LDHLVPRSLGGSNGAKNRQVVCAACNRIKRDAPTQTVEDAREFLSRFRIDLDRWFQRYRAAFRAEVVAEAK
jgi:5-methylcytosine-specific restriction endonuclease McrA